MKTIYELLLHEEIARDDWFILRVAGGWIYRHRNNTSPVFVPYDNGFDPKINEDQQVPF